MDRPCGLPRRPRGERRHNGKIRNRCADLQPAALRVETIVVEVLGTGNFRLEKYVYGRLPRLCCAREMWWFFPMEHQVAESRNTPYCGRLTKVSVIGHSPTRRQVAASLENLKDSVTVAAH